MAKNARAPLDREWAICFNCDMMWMMEEQDQQRAANYFQETTGVFADTGT